MKFNECKNDYLQRKFLGVICLDEFEYIDNHICINGGSVFGVNGIADSKQYDTECPKGKTHLDSSTIGKSELFISNVKTGGRSVKKYKIDYELPCSIHNDKNVIFIGVSGKKLVCIQGIETQLHRTHKLKNLTTVVHKLLDYYERSLSKLFTHHKYYIYSHKKMINKLQPLIEINSKVHSKMLKKINKSLAAEVKNHMQIIGSIIDYLYTFEKWIDSLEANIQKCKEAIESVNLFLSKPSFTITELNSKHLEIQKIIDVLVEFSKGLLEAHKKMAEIHIKKYSIHKIPFCLLPIGKSICFKIDGFQEVTMELKSASLLQPADNVEYKGSISMNIEDKHYDKCGVFVREKSKIIDDNENYNFSLLSKYNKFSSEVSALINQEQSCPGIDELCIFFITFNP